MTWTFSDGGPQVKSFTTGLENFERYASAVTELADELEADFPRMDTLEKQRAVRGFGSEVSKLDGCITPMEDAVWDMPSERREEFRKRIEGCRKVVGGLWGRWAPLRKELWRELRENLEEFDRPFGPLKQEMSGQVPEESREDRKPPREPRFTGNERPFVKAEQDSVQKASTSPLADTTPPQREFQGVAASGIITKHITTGRPQGPRELEIQVLAASVGPKHSTIHANRTEQGSPQPPRATVWRYFAGI
jgi:hypothetical protein